MLLSSLITSLSFGGTFLLVLLFGIFLPGFLLKRALAHQVSFTRFETLLLSFALGIGIIDASLLILGRLSIALTSTNIGIWYGLLLAFLLAILWFRKIPLKATFLPLLTSKKQFQVATILIVLIFFIKVFYLSGTILPTATDLGHHLYWAKLTSDSAALPVYEKQEVIKLEDGNYAMSEPVPIADFIIGEHLPLTFIHIFTGALYTGTFPVLFLFLLNIGSVFALSLLAWAIGKKIIAENKWTFVTPPSFFLLALFIFGGLFALASPEMKFVTGGVIGNLFGNFFIPLIFLFLIRALTEKSAPLLAITLLLATSLAYTHHLSTFITLYVIMFLIFSLLLFWRRRFFTEIVSWLRLFKQPVLISTVTGIILFALFIAIPTYMAVSAIDTALGSPTKTTRTGLTLAQLTFANSAFKVGLALSGIMLIASLTTFRKNFGAVLLFAYGLVLLIMTMAPALLLVDIPSNRIAHYLSFPLTLLTILVTLTLLEKWSTALPKIKHVLYSPLLLGIFLIFWLALVVPGLEDNNQTLSSNSAQALYVQETFSAAGYLKEHVPETDLILKDHNFIQASDTWMKIFFSKGYNYPLSRSFFKRYSDNPEREQCTLAMIATPNTAFAKKCYQDLPIRFLVVNPKYDQAQLLKSPRFSLVYSSPDIAIFHFIPKEQ